MMAIDPRLHRSMCLGCYNVKIKLDMQIDKMLKPYQLAEEIFITREKDERPTINLIPISQTTF